MPLQAPLLITSTQRNVTSPLSFYQFFSLSACFPYRVCAIMPEDKGKEVTLRDVRKSNYSRKKTGESQRIAQSATRGRAAVSHHSWYLGCRAGARQQGLRYHTDQSTDFWLLLCKLPA